MHDQGPFHRDHCLYVPTLPIDSGHRKAFLLMAGVCKHCGFSGTHDALAEHAGKCPMTREPDIIEVRWGDFVTVQDPRLSYKVSGLVVSCYPRHITINPGKSHSLLKTHRGHVVERVKGFAWKE